MIHIMVELKTLLSFGWGWVSGLNKWVAESQSICLGFYYGGRGHANFVYYE